MKSFFVTVIGIGLISFIFCASGGQTATATDGAKTTVDLNVFHHVYRACWVVKDLDGVLAYWKKLGLKDIREGGIAEFPDAVFRGRKSPLSVRIAFASLGNATIEWLQPVKGTGIHQEFLRRHGDGVMSLCYLVASPAELAKQLSYFKSRGVEVVESGSWQAGTEQGKFAYLDTAARGGGIYIELIYSPGESPEGPVEPSDNLYPLNHLTQYAFVVRDVKKVSYYYASLGFNPMPIDQNVSVDRMYRGKPGSFEMYLGWWRFGDITYEWIQSLKGPSVYDEYLRAHGEGLHHLAFEVRDMDEATKLMASRGAPVSQSGGWVSPGSKGRFAYLDSEPHGGVTIELLCDAPQKK
jgi:catechol 2,3-dioxygenase-like lactoylglutathione lyase family enzyme